MDFQKPLLDFLSKNEILSLATSDGKEVYVCNLHYSSDDSFNLYFASKPDRQHSKNIGANKEVAICIYNTAFAEGDVFGGIQMKGTCVNCNREESKVEIDKFYKKFPDKFGDEAKEMLSNLGYRVFYKFTPTRVKLIQPHSWEFPIEIHLPEQQGML